MMRRHYEQGMTLLEILVALTIFILVAGAGYTGLQQGLVVQDSLQQTRQYWRRLDAVMTLLQQDLDQARNLTQRIPQSATLSFSGASEPNPGLQGEILAFTRGGHRSFSAGLVSPHLRVSYQLRDETLYRVSWPRLNMPETEQGAEAELISNVTEVQLRFLDSSRRWLDNWPVVTGGITPTDLPRAVQLLITLEDNQSYERIFHVGDTR